jgi:hypothetical protein
VKVCLHPTESGSGASPSFATAYSTTSTGHTFAEIEPLVSAEVAARLDQDKRYGIWWFNRERVAVVQMAENRIGERRYRQRFTRTPKPDTEWIAVPVPDSGVPREWVDAARMALANNERTSKNDGRFWELSGGVMRCGSCGWSIKSATVATSSRAKRNHYYRCSKLNNYGGDCVNRKSHRADSVEPRVWDFVSGLLQDPQRLRADLDVMIELEREGRQGNPHLEAKVWIARLAELDYQRARAQDAYLEGVFEIDELRSKLASLQEACEAARRELAALETHQEHLAEMERNRDALVERYAGMAPEALASLTPEERHQTYKLLKLKVDLHVDGRLEVSGALEDGAKFCPTEKLSTWISGA